MTWRGMRMAPEKVRRRGLRHPPPVRLAVSCFFFNRIFIFCELNVWVRKTRIKMKRSLKRKLRKVHRSWELMKISGQNILKINEGKSPLGMHRGRRQMQHCNQDNGRGPGLVRYAMWKSDTKSAAWESSDVGIYSDLSSVSSYPSQITLYRSLHTCRQSILESTIQEISYLEVLKVAGSSMDTWKTR